MSAVSVPHGMPRWLANALLLLTAMIWGSAFVAQNLGMKHIGPFLFTGARFVLGALVILPLVLRESRRRRDAGQALSPKDGGLAVLLGCLLFGGAALQQIGIVTTTVTNAGFFTALYVPLVPLLGWLLWRHWPHYSVWPASAACLLGTWWLGGGELSGLNVGDGWILASTVFWAGHVLLVGRVAAGKPAAVTVAFIQFVICGVLSLAVAQWSEVVSQSALMQALPAILYTGILSVGVAFTLQVVAQRHTSAADSAILLSSETVFAALGGALWLGETLNPMQLSGCALILSGILAVQLLPLWRPKAFPVWGTRS